MAIGPAESDAPQVMPRLLTTSHAKRAIHLPGMLNGFASHQPESD